MLIRIINYYFLYVLNCMWRYFENIKSIKIFFFKRKQKKKDQFLFWFFPMNNENNLSRVEFSPFKTFEIDSVTQIKNNATIIKNADSYMFPFDEKISSIFEFFEKQIRSEDVIFFPQDELNVISFSPESKKVHDLVKEKVLEFSQNSAKNLVNIVKYNDISQLWHSQTSIMKNVSYYFDRFFVNDESQDGLFGIFYSECKNLFSANKEFISLLHQSVVESLNHNTIYWFSVDCADILSKCGLFDISIVIRDIKVEFNSLQTLDSFVRFSHHLIPYQYHNDILGYITNSIADFSTFFEEVPNEWKSISTLFEIYEYKNEINDFIARFTNLVKSKFTLYNPFKIFDEVHSLVSTKFIYVMRNIIATLFTHDNETSSILLANYIHVTFSSLKEKISDERLFLFDEFSQQSNGFFVRYHCHNLLRRLLFYKSVIFDADERFAHICNNQHMLSIVNDFKKQQQIIQKFNKFQSLNFQLHFSIFNSEFFSLHTDNCMELFGTNMNSEKSIALASILPDGFLSMITSFETYVTKEISPYKKIKWNLELSHATLKAINIENLNFVNCNGKIAIVLLELSKLSVQNVITKDDIYVPLKSIIDETEIDEIINILKSFSLITIDPNSHNISINNSLNIDGGQINIPSIPKINDMPQNNIVNGIHLEAVVARYVKLHPNQPRNDVYNYIKPLINFEFTEKDFLDAISSLIRKQILSPLNTDTLSMSYP